jgi:hypothetical protein
MWCGTMIEITALPTHFVEGWIIYEQHFADAVAICGAGQTCLALGHGSLATVDQ